MFKYIKNYKIFESDSTDSHVIAVKQTISIIKKITEFMEEDVRKTCEDMGIWNMDSLRIRFSGFGHSGYDSDGYDFGKDEHDGSEPASLEQMADWVIEDGFPLRGEKTQTGFGINIELSDEYLRKNDLDPNDLPDKSAGLMYRLLSTTNKKADLNTEIMTLRYSHLLLTSGKQLSEILSKKYTISDIEQDGKSAWLSIEYYLKDYFDRSKNLFTDINK